MSTLLKQWPSNSALPASRWWPDPKRTKAIKTIHKFADDVIGDAITRLNNTSTDIEKATSKPPSPDRYVFLHELLKQTQDPYVVRSELLNVLLAGRDTTAGLLANTWWVLARRPDIWAKLQAEIHSHCGTNPDTRPDYATIKDMSYLKYVLNESLRVMPVVPANSRTAIVDTVLPLGGGPEGQSPLFIPKDTVVGYLTWSMHRRQDYYGEDADEFKPERWEKLRPGWEYLPFNGGPRICLGQQYALLEASYATIRLMQRFKGVEPRDQKLWSEFVTLTLASGTGSHVALFEQG